MSSTLREIADAIASALASQNYGAVDVQPTVFRKNWATVDTEQLRDPAIIVSPGTLAITRASRTVHQYDCDALIFVGRHVSTEAEADAMLDLAEEVIDLLREHTWGEDISFPGGATSPVAIEIDVNPDEALAERNVWRAVITARYTLFRNDS